VDIDVARHVIRAAFRSAGELDSLLSLLKAHCTADEYTTYAKAIATAIASIHLEVMDKATAGTCAAEDWCGDLHERLS
jgi:hypothetical protein